MKYLSIGAAMACVAFFSFSVAEPKAASTSKPAKSNGIEMSVSSVAFQSGQLIVQIVATNTNKSRVYLRDALGDNAQRGFLGSGTQLGGAQVSGIDTCSSDAADCISGVNDKTNPDVYSYIEPGDTLAFALSYGISGTPAPSDTISFSLAMAGSITSADEEPDQLGKLKSLRFSFPYVPLSSN